MSTNIRIGNWEISDIYLPILETYCDVLVKLIDMPYNYYLSILVVEY